MKHYITHAKDNGQMSKGQKKYRNAQRQLELHNDGDAQLSDRELYAVRRIVRDNERKQARRAKQNAYA